MLRSSSAVTLGESSRSRARSKSRTKVGSTGMVGTTPAAILKEIQKIESDGTLEYSEFLKFWSHMQVDEDSFVEKKESLILPHPARYLKGLLRIILESSNGSKDISHHITRTSILRTIVFISHGFTFDPKDKSMSDLLNRVIALGGPDGLASASALLTLRFTAVEQTVSVGAQNASILIHHLLDVILSPPLHRLTKSGPKTRRRKSVVSIEETSAEIKIKDIESNVEDDKVEDDNDFADLAFMELQQIAEQFDLGGVIFGAVNTKLLTLSRALKTNPEQAGEWLEGLCMVIKILLRWRCHVPLNVLVSTMEALVPCVFWPAPYSKAAVSAINVVEGEVVRFGEAYRSVVERERSLRGSGHLETKKSGGLMGRKEISAAVYHIGSTENSFLSKMLEIEPISSLSLPSHEKWNNALVLENVINLTHKFDSWQTSEVEDLLAAKLDDVPIILKEVKSIVSESLDRLHQGSDPRRERKWMKVSLHKIKKRILAASDSKSWKSTNSKRSSPPTSQPPSRTTSDARVLSDINSDLDTTEGNPIRAMGPFSPLGPQAVCDVLSDEILEGLAAREYLDLCPKLRHFALKGSLSLQFGATHMPAPGVFHGLEKAIKNVQSASRINKTQWGMRLVVSGGLEEVHASCAAYINALAAGLLHGRNSPRFLIYFVATEENPLSAFISSFDSWYHRHVYKPFHRSLPMTPWCKQIDSDSTDNLGGDERPIPGLFYERLLTNYLREARREFPVQIMLITAYRRGRKERSKCIIPFLISCRIIPIKARNDPARTIKRSRSASVVALAKDLTRPKRLSNEAEPLVLSVRMSKADIEATAHIEPKEPRDKKERKKKDRIPQTTKAYTAFEIWNFRTGASTPFDESASVSYKGEGLQHVYWPSKCVLGAAVFWCC
ncbi:hypothetical protein AAMO2058_000835300 [Amorphochlora amoebiformis]